MSIITNFSSNFKIPGPKNRTGTGSIADPIAAGNLKWTYADNSFCNSPSLRAAELLPKLKWRLTRQSKKNRIVLWKGDMPMNDNSILNLILEELKSLKNDVGTLKSDVEELKSLKSDVAELKSLKSDMGTLKSDVEELKSLKSDVAELKSLKSDMEVLKIKSELTYQKLNDLTLDVKIAERSIRKDISRLKDAQETIIEVLEQKNILPKAN